MEADSERAGEVRLEELKSTTKKAVLEQDNIIVPWLKRTYAKLAEQKSGMYQEKQPLSDEDGRRCMPVDHDGGLIKALLANGLKRVQGEVKDKYAAYLARVKRKHDRVASASGGGVTRKDAFDNLFKLCTVAVLKAVLATEDIIKPKVNGKTCKSKADYEQACRETFRTMSVMRDIVTRLNITTASADGLTAECVSRVKGIDDADLDDADEEEGEGEGEDEDGEGEGEGRASKKARVESRGRGDRGRGGGRRV